VALFDQQHVALCCPENKTKRKCTSSMHFWVWGFEGQATFSFLILNTQNLYFKVSENSKKIFGGSQ
jgi:hypothetical protein